MAIPEMNSSSFLTTESPLVTSSSTLMPDFDISSEKPVRLQGSAYYVLVPLTVILIIFLAAALVFLIIRKRRLDELRHTLMPLYSFDPADEGEADWESELLDSAMTRPTTLHPSSLARKGYRSVDSPDAPVSGPYQV